MLLFLEYDSISCTKVLRYMVSLCSVVNKDFSAYSRNPGFGNKETGVGGSKGLVGLVSERLSWASISLIRVLRTVVCSTGASF